MATQMQVRRVEVRDVEALRDLYRQEANCQIIRDSFLARGLADPYLILVGGQVGGYGAVANKYDKGRLVEFYTLPHARGLALPMCREILGASEATHVEAQTNVPMMLLMLFDCATNVTAEKVLFHDAHATHLACPVGVFRRRVPEDQGPEGEWVVEAGGAVVAAGGFLCHYNPPYGDVYMEVAEPAWRRGFGSYLVQEVKRACYAAGRKPAARCDTGNVGSRKTLERAGLLPCARLLVGDVAPPGPRA